MAAREGSREEKSFKEEARDIVDEEFAGLTDADAADVDEEEDLEASETLDDEDEPLDDDEDLDDVDDEQQQDDEHSLDDEDAEPAAEGVDRGDGRDAKGKFATKAEQDAADAKAKQEQKETAAAGQAAGDPAKPAGDKPADAAAPPAFMPYKLRADKEDVPIPEAQITRANGYVMLAVPEKDFPRFEARIGRGHVAEKVWQRLTLRERELEAEKNAPPRKSDAEIEAEMTMEVIKDHLSDLLTPIELENLELKIKHAQREYNDKYATERSAYFERATKETTPDQDEEAEAMQGLAAHLLIFRESSPELKDLTDAELQQVYTDLAKVRRAVFWKEGGEFYANNQLIAEKLLDIKARRSTTATGTGALPDKGTTAAAAGTSKTKPDAAAAADRFNRGVDSAKKPGGKTTSLKANRGTQGARSRGGDPARNTRSDRDDDSRERVAGRTTSPELDAEEQWRRTQKNFMKSDTLDFDDDADD